MFRNLRSLCNFKCHHWRTCKENICFCNFEKSLYHSKKCSDYIDFKILKILFIILRWVIIIPKVIWTTDIIPFIGTATFSVFSWTLPEAAGGGEMTLVVLLGKVKEPISQNVVTTKGVRTAVQISLIFSKLFELLFLFRSYHRCCHWSSKNGED